MNLRAGWTPRILGAVLALFAAWFVVVHADGFLPAIGQVVGLGPYALPIGLAIVAVGVLNRGLQAHASFRLVELPARFGAMLHLSATSYATNKVVKSAGTAGLVPYLAHADRAGECRARVSAAYLATKLAETVSLCCLIGLAVVAGAATGGLHGAALWGAVASGVYALVVGTVLVLVAGRRSLVEAIATRIRRVAFWFRDRFARPHPEPGGACAGHELSCAMDRMRADPRAADPAARNRLRRQAARLCRAVHGARRTGDPPRAGDDAARVHAHPHGGTGRPAPRRHRHRRRFARCAPRGERGAGTVGRRGRRRLPPARPVVAAPRGRRGRSPAVPAEPRHRPGPGAAEPIDSGLPVLAAVGAG